MFFKVIEDSIRQMNNNENFEYEYQSEPEMNIVNFARVCRFCDNLKKGRSLKVYIRGLDQLKTCIYCRNELCAIKNNMYLTRIARLYREQKRRKAKQNVVIALHQLRIGIQAGIHQNILEYVL